MKIVWFFHSILVRIKTESTSIGKKIIDTFIKVFTLGYKTYFWVCYVFHFVSTYVCEVHKMSWDKRNVKSSLTIQWNLLRRTSYKTETSLRRTLLLVLAERGCVPHRKTSLRGTIVRRTPLKDGHFSIGNYLLRQTHPKLENNFTQIGWIMSDIVCKSCWLIKNADFIVCNWLSDLYFALVNHFYVY